MNWWIIWGGKRSLEQLKRCRDLFLTSLISRQVYKREREEEAAGLCHTGVCGRWQWQEQADCPRAQRLHPARAARAELSPCSWSSRTALSCSPWSPCSAEPARATLPSIKSCPPLEHPAGWHSHEAARGSGGSNLSCRTGELEYVCRLAITEGWAESAAIKHPSDYYSKYHKKFRWHIFCRSWVCAILRKGI